MFYVAAAVMFVIFIIMIAVIIDDASHADFLVPPGEHDESDNE